VKKIPAKQAGICLFSWMQGRGIGVSTHGATAPLEEVMPPSHRKPVRLINLVFAVALCAAIASASPPAALRAAGDAPAQPAASPRLGFVYALLDDAAGNKIYGYEVITPTGTLAALAGFPVATGGTGDGTLTAERLALDAANRRLYAINNGSDTVSAYSIDPNSGALAALPFSPISLGSGNWACLAVHPSGSPLIVGESDPAGRLASVAVTESTATAAPGNPAATGVQPSSCAFSRDGSYAYASGGPSNGIAAFNVNPATGALTALAGSPFNSGAATPTALATDASGRLFAANFSADQVRAFDISAGAPAAVTGNPFTSNLVEAAHGVVHPAGFYLVADRGDAQVGVYRITGAGAGTTLGSVSGGPFGSAGSNTTVVATDHLGAFVFAANGGSRNISSFRMDTASGVLASAGNLPINALGASGSIGGMAYVDPLRRIYLPIAIKQ
jgi:6-phosphogluconolactonase (cycloisomerase 2 family)